MKQNALPHLCESRSSPDGCTASRISVRAKAEFKCLRAMLPNHSLKLTRYGMHCLAAPGQVCYFPCAAKQRMPPRLA